MASNLVFCDYLSFSLVIQRKICGVEKGWRGQRHKAGAVNEHSEMKERVFLMVLELYENDTRNVLI